MDFKLGEKVVYPNHGVGVIEQINHEMWNGKTEKCYLLRIVSSGARVTVSHTNAEVVGLRPVIRPNDTGKVLNFLEKGRCTNHHDWKHRFKENSERMRTGSLLDVAAVLKSLVALSRTKPLSFREKKMLERARQLLVSEMALAKRMSVEEAESSLARALAKAHLELPPAASEPGD